MFWGTMTAEAVEVRKSFSYLRLARKLMSPGPAWARVAAPEIWMLGSPKIVPPTWSASSLTVLITGDYLYLSGGLPIQVTGIIKNV